MNFKKDFALKSLVASAACAFLFSLAACGDDNPSSPADDSSSSISTGGVR